MNGSTYMVEYENENARNEAMFSFNRATAREKHQTHTHTHAHTRLIDLQTKHTYYMCSNVIQIHLNMCVRWLSVVVWLCHTLFRISWLWTTTKYTISNELSSFDSKSARAYTDTLLAWIIKWLWDFLIFYLLYSILFLLRIVIFEFNDKMLS